MSSSYTLARLGTANMYDGTISNISKQQQELVKLIEQASTSKRVNRASDDPVAAAQAERARTRMNRIETDQRALDAQVATVTQGEAALGSINDAMQEFRQLVVNAGNGSYTQSERDALVYQMESLRDQISKYANQKDSNGLPLFRGLDSLANPAQGSNYAGQAGQMASGEYGITSSLDGALAFYSGATGNGVLAVGLGAGNTGKAWADVGSIKNPSDATALVAPDTVTITFGVDATTGATTYTVAGGVNDGATGTYKSGEAINVQGMDLTITGVPGDGDTFTISPSQRTDIFSVMDSAIAAARNSGNIDGSTAYGELAHGLAKSLAEIDTAMNRVSTVRSFAGDLLNRADRVSTTLEAQSDLQETNRSKAEDADMIDTLSRLETLKTNQSAALQSYASIQKLSLFNYIG